MKEHILHEVMNEQEIRNKINDLCKSEKDSIEEKVIIADIMNSELVKIKFETSNENQIRLFKSCLDDRRFLLNLSNDIVDSDEYERIINQNTNTKLTTDTDTSDDEVELKNQKSNIENNIIDCRVSIIDFDDGDRLVLGDSVFTKVLNKIKSLFRWRSDEL